MIGKGFPVGASGKESPCQCRRCGFDPWVGRIPWRRKWQPTPSFLPGESPWTGESGRLQSMGSQRVRQDWVSEKQRQEGPLPPRTGRRKALQEAVGMPGLWGWCGGAQAQGVPSLIAPTMPHVHRQQPRSWSILIEDARQSSGERGLHAAGGKGSPETAVSTGGPQEGQERGISQAVTSHIKNLCVPHL